MALVLSEDTVLLHFNQIRVTGASSAYRMKTSIPGQQEKVIDMLAIEIFIIILIFQCIYTEYLELSVNYLCVHWNAAQYEYKYFYWTKIKNLYVLINYIHFVITSASCNMIG
jgi:hypothetical protein